MPAFARFAAMMCSVLVLGSCQEDGVASVPDATPVPAMVTEARTQCERDGGTWALRGSALFTCYRPTRDANQSCSAGTDCEGLCLARSRTCAPVTPFLGCHEVLTDGGTRATRCVN